MDSFDPEETRRALFSAGIGLWSCDLGSREVRLSATAESLLGLVSEGATRWQLDSVVSRVSEEFHDALRAYLFRAIDPSAERPWVQGAALTVSTRDGRALEFRGGGAGAGVAARSEAGTQSGEMFAAESSRSLGTLTAVAPLLALEDSGAASALPAAAATETDPRPAYDPGASLIAEFASDYVYEAEFTYGVPLVPNVVAGSFERTTGYTIDDVARKGGWFAIIHPEDRERALELARGLYPGRRLLHEYRIVDSEGGSRWLRDRLRVEGDPVTGVITKVMGGVTDITEHRELAEQLIQAQKTEALARLAGGVAHDFNNLLTIVLGEVAHLRHGERDMPLARLESYEAIGDAIRRSTELTRALLSFGRRTVGERRVLSLRSALVACKPLLARSLGEDIALHLSVDEVPDVRVSMDLGEMQLVLLNLALNARDAMNGRGTFAIHALEVHYDDQEASRPPQLRAGHYVNLLVRDTGAGMSAAVLAKAADPYFSTKEPGRGTGLGLATASGLVSRAGGTLTLASTMGVGTTASVYLPTTQEPVDTAVSPLSRIALGGSERVLVVEDEPALRKIMVRSLRQIGYRVTEVADAEMAMKLDGELLADVDLVVTDVRLPGMDGISLIEQLRAQRPSLRVLVTSGEIDEATALRLENEVYPFLAKPFAPEVLIAFCEDVLSGVRSAGNGPHDTTPPRSA